MTQDFLEAFGQIDSVFDDIAVVPRALSLLVNDFPYISFILGFSMVLGLVTWVIKASIKG